MQAITKTRYWCQKCDIETLTDECPYCKNQTKWLGEPDAYGRQFWLVSVPSLREYLVAYTTEFHAEEIRCARANWFKAVAHKRHLLPEDAEDMVILEQYFDPYINW